MGLSPKGQNKIVLQRLNYLFVTFLRWFEWDFLENEEHVAMKSSNKILTKLEDVGVQLALAFNSEGSILAAGGEVSIFPLLFCHLNAVFNLFFLTNNIMILFRIFQISKQKNLIHEELSQFAKPALNFSYLMITYECSYFHNAINL